MADSLLTNQGTKNRTSRNRNKLKLVVTASLSLSGCYCYDLQCTYSLLCTTAFVIRSPATNKILSVNGLGGFGQTTKSPFAASSFRHKLTTRIPTLAPNRIRTCNKKGERNAHRPRSLSPSKPNQAACGGSAYTDPAQSSKPSLANHTKAVNVKPSPVKTEQRGRNGTHSPFFLNSLLQNTTTLEMTAMSTLGLTISTTVIATLAMNNDPSSSINFVNDLLQFSGDVSATANNAQELVSVLSTDGVDVLEDALGGINILTENVLQAALPSSATDVFSVALGEGIAGSIGALATWAVGALLKLRVDANEAAAMKDRKSKHAKAAGEGGAKAIQYTPAKRLKSIAAYQKNNQKNWKLGFPKLATEAVADGDYFITRAAVFPLLALIGFSPIATTLLGVIISTVPYEIIKITSRQRNQRREENGIMDKLLLNYQERETVTKSSRNKSPVPPLTGGSLNESDTVKTPSTYGTDFPFSEDKLKGTELLKSTVASSPGLAGQTDVVELFSDITKWLEFEVLTKDFSGMLTWHGSTISRGVESAAFGLLAALSSQLYADVIYKYTDYGLEANRQESRNRTLDGWASLYSTKCLSAATLFGVYETVRGPVSQWIARILAGGVEGCFGSKNFNLCMDTYTNYNPPGATSAAQMRSFLTALASLPDKMGLEFSDSMTFEEFGRGLIVQLYSFGGHYFN